MRAMRKIFGWLFGMVAIVCIGASAFGFRDDLLRNNGALRFGAFVGPAALLILAITFAMACWSSWNQRSAARAWGIAASLVIISVPLLNMRLSHRHMTSTDLQMIVFGAFAFAAYVWPDPEREAADAQGDMSSSGNEADEDNKAPQSEPQCGRLGVLRAYALIVAAAVVLIAVLRSAHAPWGVVGAFLVLACVVALFGEQLIGPNEHVQISSPSFELRIQHRYRFEYEELSNLGFTLLFCYGETFPLRRLLLIYPAFLFLIMWLNREVGTLQSRARLLLGFPVFISSNRATYAQPMQLGVKFFTLFQDGTILLTKSFGGKAKYGPTVVVHRMRNASISYTWAEHQKQAQALEATGKQIDREVTFETFSNISRKA